MALAAERPQPPSARPSLLELAPLRPATGLDVRTDHIKGGVRSLPVSW